MIEDKLINKLKTGICPFTGQRYDCARCEIEPERVDIPSDTPGTYELHMCFEITRFVFGQTTKLEMKQLARCFTNEDGKHPTPEWLMEYFRTLHSFGVEKIPMCDCERFCFRHGCMGDRKETEDRQ